MDHFEGETIPEEKPKAHLCSGAQWRVLFSVSLHRDNRSLPAWIEQWNPNFSFNAHDPYMIHCNRTFDEDPSSCMVFEPLLTISAYRTFSLRLQCICHAVICRCPTNHGTDGLPLLVLSVTGFLFTYLIIFMFIWLSQVLVAACGTFMACRIFSCGVWDLVSWPGALY